MSGVAPLGSVLTITFFASVSGGAFWAGIFFVTAAHYGFSPTQNLVLASATGLSYALTARFTGRLLRALERRFSGRAILGGALGTWGLAALAPLADRDNAALLAAVAMVGSVASAVTWPVVESFLGAGRHGPRMRQAIGWFNVTWTPATALPLLLMPLFARVDLLLTIAVSALTNAVALVALLWLPARAAAHGAEAAAAVGAEYPALLRAASWLLPLSYLMSAILAPILPHRLAAFGGAAPASVVAATWMVARFVTLAVMGRLHFWHGRWGTLMLAAASLLGGLALVFLAPSLPVVVLGLFVFGAGAGITYYAALYYSLAVGHAAVDAGGNFEALIGLGYGLGPLLGLLGAHLAGGEAGARALTVALAWVTAFGFLARAARPYLAARRSR